MAGRRLIFEETRFLWIRIPTRLGSQSPCCCCLVTKSCPTLRPHGLQHAKLPCPSVSSQSPCTVHLTFSLRCPVLTTGNRIGDMSGFPPSETTFTCSWLSTGTSWVPQPYCPGNACPTFSNGVSSSARGEVARDSGFSLLDMLAFCHPVER